MVKDIDLVITLLIVIKLKCSVTKMGLIQQARIRATTIKLIPSLIRKTDLELQEELDKLKAKYSINDYDYVYMNVAIAMMGEKEMLMKKGTTSQYILEEKDLNENTL